MFLNILMDCYHYFVSGIMVLFEVSGKSFGFLAKCQLFRGLFPHQELHVLRVYLTREKI